MTEPTGDRRPAVPRDHDDTEGTAVRIVDYRHHTDRVQVFEDADEAFPWTVVYTFSVDGTDDVIESEFPTAPEAFQLLAELVNRLEH